MLNVKCCRAAWSKCGRLYKKTMRLLLLLQIVAVCVVQNCCQDLTGRRSFFTVIVCCCSSGRFCTPSVSSNLKYWNIRLVGLYLLFEQQCICAASAQHNFICRLSLYRAMYTVFCAIFDIVFVRLWANICVLYRNYLNVVRRLNRLRLLIWFSDITRSVESPVGLLSAGTSYRSGRRKFAIVNQCVAISQKIFI